ncbi:amino acid ABC transporter permease [Brenneria corticis]|uniref:Amino acid ABC transporter permease n=1 Tax=Brenneria corticis TaxID=2173106 RepID=A0A2U1U6L7_9GAMM|nr:amino acid ABC transporter permease [Brenneria sp. CFCC 11842]PWC17214.1 amino acid ABC transporter permease [Brenneria sp. CFCC 11842]
MTLLLDFSYMMDVFPRIARSVPLTLYILTISCFFSLLLGSLIAIVRIRRTPVLYELSSLCLSFFRSIPNILNILLIYYGLPVALESLGMVVNWEKSTFCIVALVLIYGSFVAEYLRPAWLSVERKVHDAAESIGMTKWQKTRRIIIPLAFPVALPSLNNAVIDMLKDTSILFIIGLPDIMGRINSIVATDYGVKKLEVYIAGGLTYAGLILATTYLMHRIERRYSKFLAIKSAEHGDAV